MAEIPDQPSEGEVPVDPAAATGPPPAPPLPHVEYAPGETAMNPVSAWKLVVLERYTKFDGRALRQEYWWFALANFIVLIALFILSAISKVFFVLYFLYAIGVIIPSIAVTVRRLHDTDRSGWWILIDLIPFIGPIVLLVFLCIDSSRGPNKYGESEKYPLAA
jgi:uncharacterized membrane protein YhaH (DUF805 family)